MPSADDIKKQREDLLSQASKLEFEEQRQRQTEQRQKARDNMSPSAKLYEQKMDGLYASVFGTADGKALLEEFSTQRPLLYDVILEALERHNKPQG